MEYYMTAGTQSGVTIESFKDIEDAIEQIHEFWYNDSEDGRELNRTVYCIHVIEFKTDKLLGIHRFDKEGNMYFVDKETIDKEPIFEYIDEGDEEEYLNEELAKSLK